MRVKAFGGVAVVLLLILTLVYGLRAAAAVVELAYTADVPLPTRVIVRPTNPPLFAVTATPYPIGPGRPR